VYEAQDLHVLAARQCGFDGIRIDRIVERYDDADGPH
jgi:hypothetical protein